MNVGEDGTAVTIPKMNTKLEALVERHMEEKTKGLSIQLVLQWEYTEA